MKKALLIVCCILYTYFSFSQDNSKEYTDLVNSGFSFYSKQDYKNAAIKFTSAVDLKGDKVDINIRRSAAFCWALANYPDSAFYQLNIVSNIETLTFPDYVNFTSDNDFISLHADLRWKEFCEKVLNTAKKTFYFSMKTAGGEVSVFDLYNAAFAWSLNNNPDSAFYYLNIAADSRNLTFENVNTIIKNITIFAPLLKDKRWQGLKDRMFAMLSKKYISSAFNKKYLPKRIHIDGGHYNYHTIEGTYEVLAGTLNKVGFQVASIKGQFNKITLENTDILIIANPHVYLYDSLVQRAKVANEPFRWSAAAAQPAYTKNEAESIVNWVKKGGLLLLILDHAPNPMAGSPITAAFGVDYPNTATYDRLSRDPAIDTSRAQTILFTRSKGLIGNHPILYGVDSVTTYTGGSLLGPPNSNVLLYLPTTATDRDWDPATKKFRNLSSAGRSQGIAFEYGRGRVVILGEAAIINPESTSRSDRGNWQMTLNILRWLTGNLK